MRAWVIAGVLLVGCGDGSGEMSRWRDGGDAVPLCQRGNNMRGHETECPEGMQPHCPEFEPPDGYRRLDVPLCDTRVWRAACSAEEDWPDCVGCEYGSYDEPECIEL